MVSSGPISLGGNATTSGLNQSVNIELGRAATASINMNEAAVRGLFAVASGAISMSNGYGKSNRVARSITIASNTANYVLNTAQVSGYVAGTTDVTLTINSGVFISSGSTGSYAFTVNTSWAAGDTITIVNNGTIVGCGGNGGGGGGGGSFGQTGAGGAGASGGPALLVQRAITMNNLNRIAGGGGGGAGQGSSTQLTKAGFYMRHQGGNGGGGGIGNSTGGGGGGGSGLAFGTAGSGGTLTGAGAGGQNGCGAGGGAGGGYGSNGGSAPTGCQDTYQGGGGVGVAGICIQGNSNITYTNTGTRNGTINA
jgi:hypothetical protein